MADGTRSAIIHGGEIEMEEGEDQALQEEHISSEIVMETLKRGSDGKSSVNDGLAELMLCFKVIMDRKILVKLLDCTMVWVQNGLIYLQKIDLRRMGVN